MIHRLKYPIGLLDRIKNNGNYNRCSYTIDVVYNRSQLFCFLNIHNLKMAIIEVSGIVKKKYSSFFVISERVTLPGYDFEKNYNVWSDEDIQIGSSVFVRGTLSTKIKKYTDEKQAQKVYVESSINDPVITPISPVRDPKLPDSVKEALLLR